MPTSYDPRFHSQRLPSQHQLTPDPQSLPYHRAFHGNISRHLADPQRLPWQHQWTSDIILSPNFTGSQGLPCMATACLTPTDLLSLPCIMSVLMPSDSHHGFMSRLDSSILAGV